MPLTFIPLAPLQAPAVARIPTGPPERNRWNDSGRARTWPSFAHSVTARSPRLGPGQELHADRAIA